MFKTGFKLGAALLLSATFGFTAPAFGEEAPTFKLNVGGVDGPGGSIKGVVKFAGDQKPRKPIQVTADPACEAAHKDKPAFEEKFVFGDNGTLQNVFVYVSKGGDGKTTLPSINKPELDQFGCMYIPHVQGMVKGQEIKIKNSDATSHNVHSLANVNAGFNVSTGQGVIETRRFTKAEPAMAFKCDIHPWMNAYVHVMDNPYYAVTQQDGTFEIKGLPAGKYEITFWHEFAPFKPDHPTMEVTVEDGKAAEVTVTYAPPAPKAK